MRNNRWWAYCLAGAAAGTVAGLFGAGGGMIMIPILTLTVKPSEDALFPTSVCIMIPICLVAIIMDLIHNGQLPLSPALPYMLGGALGGVGAGIFAKKIPTLWLHRGLGVMILWGGIRYLC